MAIALRQLLWALFYAAISLPIGYVLTMIVLSCVEHGYVRVDPVRLRRISMALALLVFVGTFLLERLH